MAQRSRTVRLTMAQALIRYLTAQFTEVDGKEVRLCGGGFAIFGHGNVPCLGEALYAYRDDLPLWRGQNEQSMAMAAVGYAKQQLRRRFMFATSSAGPGTTNMVTAAAIAHTNRLPMLILSGDIFLSRLPDPVLQQVEKFDDPTISVTDAFKPVARYWDRITHPAQLIQSIPRALDTMLDPADCGPAFLALPQDVQGWAFDYPEELFERRMHRMRRQAPDGREVVDAAAILRSAERPLIIAGGGIQYSCATAELAEFASKHRIPVVETIAGRANLLFEDALNCGPVGVTGSDSANALAGSADVVLAIGTRLQDFTTGSWAVFAREAKIISINAARHDAAKHRSVAVVGDARLSIVQLDEALGDYTAPATWQERASGERAEWNRYVDSNISPTAKDGSNRPASYAQVIGAVNRLCDPKDRIVCAAGGLPAEVTANWRTRSIGSVDIEFGYSCMGYEIAGGWGARIGQAEVQSENDTIVLVGDGSYLMLNSDIYSSVLTGMKLIIILCDNGGFAVIDKLQRNTGNESFNNLLRDCRTAIPPFPVDFKAHAKAMGANAESVGSVDELEAAFARAKASDRTYLISIRVDPHEGWTTQGHAWWEVGTPQVSQSTQISQAHEDQESGRKMQRIGL